VSVRSPVACHDVAVKSEDGLKRMLTGLESVDDFEAGGVKC